jgi:structural maintenance of chromosome 2
MRPQEILGMVEEAAGTRMFEERKDKANKTMSKKEKRVQEILSLLSEEIAPKLEKLRAQKRSFLAYQKSCTELEKIARTLRAWDWWDGQQRVRKKESEIEGKRGEVKSVEEAKKRAVRECEAAEKEAEEVTKKRDAEMRKGGKMKKLEDEVADLGKVLVKIKTQADLKEGSIKDEEATVGALESELEEVRVSSSLCV